MLPISICVAVLPFLAPLVSAAPLSKRVATASEVLVFKFADVLEQLEAEFYKQALAKFVESDFTTAGFSASQIAIEQFQTIQSDEATHSVVLQAALQSFGETPITSCNFNFASALTDVATMAATARVVESVGVGAYLGGATLLTDPVLLTSAGSILTVEARHQTVLNILSGTGTAVPAAFDIALTPSEVLALAGPFFDGPCDLGIPANPALSLTNTGSVGPGTLLTFSSPALNSSTDGLFCQMLLGGQATSISLPLSQCVVPQINGPVAIYITSDMQPLVNNVRDRATSQLVAGPALAFIDTQPQSLGQLVRGGGAAQAVSTSTRTISPAEASSIIALSPTATLSVDSAASATVTGEASASVTSDASASVTSDASVSGTSAAPAVTSSAASSVGAYSGGSPGPNSGAALNGPNPYVGPSADGSIYVEGWTTVPAA